MRAAPPGLLLVLGLLLVPLAWVVTLPPFGGIDEFDHAFRAAAVARGQVEATAPVPDGRGLLVRVPPDLVAAAHAECASLRYTGPDNCSPLGPPGADGLVDVGSAAAGYHPAFYWIVGTIARPFDGAAALTAMRLATVGLCGLLLALAAYAAGRCGARAPGGASWPRLALVVACSPVLLYSTAVAAPNGVEMAAALGVWLGGLALLSGRDDPDPGGDRVLWLVLALCAVVICSLRLLGPVFLAGIALTLVAWAPAAARDVLRRSRRAVVLTVLAAGLSAAQFLWWVRGPGSAVGSAGPGSDDVGLSPAHGVLWVVQAIAAYPYRNQFAPWPVYLLVAGAVIVVLQQLVRHAPAHAQRVVLGALAGALVLGFLATIAAGDSRDGVIWQGRYGLPYAVGFVLLAGVGLALAGRTPSPRRRVGLLAAVMAAHVVGILGVRASESRNPVALADASWHPLPVLGLVAVGLLGLGLLVRATAPERTT